MSRHYTSTLVDAAQRRQDATGAMVGAFMGSGGLEGARTIREQAQRTLEAQTRPAAVQAAHAAAETLLLQLFDFLGQRFDADYQRETVNTWAQTIAIEADAAAETNRLLRFAEYTSNCQRAGALARRALVEGIWPDLLTSWANGPLGGARGGYAAVNGYRAVIEVARHPERNPALADLETAEALGVRMGVLPRSVLREADDAAEAAEDEGGGTAAA